MVNSALSIDLLAYAADARPVGDLETRMIEFLAAEASTESLDGAAFDRINGSSTKADYLLGGRRMIAELKTVNADPHRRTEQRLRERFRQPGAPIVFGSVGVSQVIKAMPDRDKIAKMMVDMAGRVIRRHLQKANDQIGAMKERLNLPDAGGILILMNEAEPMVDASATGYTLKNAFETVPGGYPNITNVWGVIESHRIAMTRGREGYPHLHVFRSLERQAELDFIGRMLGAWACRQGSRMERIPHHGDWDVMRPIFDERPPPLRPYE